MSDPRYFVIRRPRHSATENEQIRVWLESAACDGGPKYEAQLVDFSRKGARLSLGGPVVPDASLLVRIQTDTKSLDVTIPAVLCWQRAEGEGEWELGCQFEQEVPYEIVGELFLSGALSRES